MLGVAPAARRRPEALEEGHDRRLDTGAHVHGPTHVDPLEREPGGFGDVPHVDVVSRLEPVTVDDAGLTPQEALREDGDDACLAVRVLARPIDVGQAQDDPAESVERLPASEVELGRHLRDAVRGDGPGGMVLGRRDHVRVAVARAARRHVDDAPHAELPTSLEDVDRSHDVDLRVQARVRDGAADGGLSGQVDHGVGRLGSGRRRGGPGCGCR